MSPSIHMLVLVEEIVEGCQEGTVGFIYLLGCWVAGVEELEGFAYGV